MGRLWTFANTIIVQNVDGETFDKWSIDETLMSNQNFDKLILEFIGEILKEKG